MKVHPEKMQKHAGPYFQLRAKYECTGEVTQAKHYLACLHLLRTDFDDIRFTMRSGRLAGGKCTVPSSMEVQLDVLSICRVCSSRHW